MPVVSVEWRALIQTLIVFQFALAAAPRAMAWGLPLAPLGLAPLPPRTEAAEPTAQARQYADVQAFARGLAERFPSSARALEIGRSDSGEGIVALALGNPESPVRNLLVAAHHGNEYGAAEVALAFAEAVAKSPIDGQLLFVVPVLNVSGYDGRRRQELGADRQFHDPNRDYPGPCGSEGPYALQSTRALAEFAEKQEIVASATLHTFYPAVVYPWGIPAQDLSTPYEADFAALAQAASLESKYPVGNSATLIYPAIGSFEDWAFWKLGAWSLLFEMGGSHSPSDADLAAMIDANVPGLRRMMERAPRRRAEKHDFARACDQGRARLDRHDE
jgi:predicted deacylase